MYDAEGFQVANVLNRFAIGDRDALKYNADGSLDIYMQNGSPGTDKESNWLPAPQGPARHHHAALCPEAAGRRRPLGPAGDPARERMRCRCLLVAPRIRQAFPADAGGLSALA